MMIAFFHTSAIHVQNFEALVRKYNKEVDIKHYVNEKILKTALSTGSVDREGFEDEIERIKKDGPKLIICTCSTYGMVSDIVPGVYRIDKPIAQHLVSQYDRIGVAYTAKSTLAISKKLLEDCAESLKKTVDIVEYDCSDYWEYFENGDMKGYEKGIADIIRLKKIDVEVVFLVQASMANAKNYLGDFKLGVVSSAEFGVKSLLEQVL